MMTEIQPPIPDPDAEPLTAQQMALEGDREGSVLHGDTEPSEIDIERPDEGHDPQFAVNGE